MRTPIHRRTARLRGHPATALAPALALALALAASAGPVVAKEGFQARLDAPIGRDTPGGTTLLVGMTVTFPDGPVNHPVEGSPMYLELVGRDHSSIVAMGHEDAAHGHYTMRIEVPASGIQSVEIGIRGTSNLPIMVLGTALVPGGISSATAGVAPALAPGPHAGRPGVGRPARRRAAGRRPGGPTRGATRRCARDAGARRAAPRRSRPPRPAPGRRADAVRGPSATCHRSPRGDRASPRGLTPSCGRVRPTSPTPPRRRSFGAPRPVTRRRTGTS